jgi:catechol 2,3-dioxygenase-like lactoylglutathione lyase family enzyme
VFDHVTIRVSDRVASERFYDLVLATIGIEKTHSDENLGAEWDDFSLAPATDENPPTRRLHIAFAAPSREHVDEFWRTGVDAGYPEDGAPGLRPQYRHDYYGGFLLDPDGNSAEAVHMSLGREGIDHLWIRVADLDASRRFYELVAEHAGYYLRGLNEDPHRVQFSSDGGSFSVVAGDYVTEPFHMAFPADDNATVDAFHRAALEAGYRDHGAPGERPIYHEGYYGAYVLDPDGNNIELVNHNR